MFPIDDNTPANTPEDVSFVLDIQHENALENLVSNGMNGGHYLSTAQFAQQYGRRHPAAEDQPPCGAAARGSYAGGLRDGYNLQSGSGKGTTIGIVTLAALDQESAARDLWKRDTQHQHEGKPDRRRERRRRSRRRERRCRLRRDDARRRAVRRARTAGQDYRLPVAQYRPRLPGRLLPRSERRQRRQRLGELAKRKP